MNTSFVFHEENSKLLPSEHGKKLYLDHLIDFAMSLPL